MITQSEVGSFVSERLTQTVGELKDVRERLKTLGERLAEAEACLRFYADVRNYKVARIEDLVFQHILTDDFSPADNDPKTNLAGKRAREYLKKYGSE